MYLASFMFVPAANVNSVRATASGGVLQKASSRAPYATCCVTNLAFTTSHFMSCSHLDHISVTDPTSPGHTTSNTLWSCMCLCTLKHVVRVGERPSMSLPGTAPLDDYLVPGLAGTKTVAFVWRSPPANGWP